MTLVSKFLLVTGSPSFNTLVGGDTTLDYGPNYQFGAARDDDGLDISANHGCGAR